MELPLQFYCVFKLSGVVIRRIGCMPPLPGPSNSRLYTTRSLGNNLYCLTAKFVEPGGITDVIIIGLII